MLHLVSANEQDVAETYRIIRGELAAYGNGLAEKQEIVALSQVDSVLPGHREEKLEALEEVLGYKPMELSSVTREGVEGVLRKMLACVDGDKQAEILANTPDEEPKKGDWLEW